jgi:hypothetical protein
MPTTGTLRDIAALQNRDKVVGILDEVLGSHPEVQVLPGRTIAGTTFKVTMRKNNPKGSFRKANDGVTPGSADYYEKLVQAFIYENPIVVDARVAEANEDGAEDYLAARSEEHVAGALEGLAEQFYYGANTEDELGFPGLKSIATLDVNATGANDATATTVYLIRTGNDGVQFLFGNGTGLEVPEFTSQAFTLSNGKVMPKALVSPMGLWIGLQAVHPASVVKIKNINTASGKTLTDALIQQALEKMPAGFRNDKSRLRILANARSVGQLQTSRTAVSQAAYKSGAVADRPTESHGISIIETDSIKIGAAEYEA